ncbi:MAG: DEAD/DEAH box helicase [Candidatus Altarchaeum sp.]|nr:DEAD/DEAH box helicase [Candidatus Altarchaeum sp.]
MNLNELTQNKIRAYADSTNIFERGKRYYYNGNIKFMNVTEGGKKIYARVEGHHGIYDVNITLGKNAIHSNCTCPYDGNGCKHVVAVLLKSLYEYKDIINDNLNRSSEENTPDKENKGDNKEENSWNFVLKDIIKYTSKEAVSDAFNILEKKKIEIKSLTDREMLTEIDEKITAVYSWEMRSIHDKIKVHISRRGFDNIFSFYASCDCHPQYEHSRCKHAAASLLALFLQKNKKQISEAEEEFMSEIRAEQFYNFINKVDSILPEKPKINHEKRYLFYFNVEKHTSEYDSYFHISVVKEGILKSGAPGKPSDTTLKIIREYYDIIPANRRKIFDLFIVNLEHEKGWLTSSEKLVKTKFEGIDSSRLLTEMRNLYNEDPQAFRNCIFYNEKGEIEINISEDKNRKKAVLRLMVNKGEEKFRINKKNVDFLGKDPLWVSVYDDKKNNFILFEIECSYIEIIKNISEFSDAEIELSQLNDVIEKYYYKLSKIGKITLPRAYEIEEQNFEQIPRLYLRDYGESFSIELRFLYDKHEVLYTNRQDIVFKNEKGKIIRIPRNREKEKEYFKVLLDHHTAERDDLLMPTIDPYLWLTDVSNDLIAKGYEIYGKSELVNNKISSEDPKLKLEISSGIEWFDLKGNVSFGEEGVSFAQIISSINSNERFIKLSDGRRGVIPKKWLDKLSGITGLLEQDEKNETVRASRSQIAIIEELLNISEMSKADEKFKEIRAKFSGFKEIKHIPLPKKLNGELRAYQKAGYDWLQFLKEFDLGGCLADEMGLGKTVQALSLLLYEKEHGINIPSLVIVPASLVFNWVNEIRKFTPSLNVYVHHGLERVRDSTKIWKKNADIILTTYATLRNDTDMFKNKGFHYVILDESQNIKNPLSKTTKEIYKLKAKHKLAMTGTPIENNSFELWSLFAFLNPGLLGNIKYFKETFAKSIEKEKDKHKTNALKNIINPFLLMRKKEMVAKELPEKQIFTSYCEMEPEQREIYEAWKFKIKKEIENAINAGGFMKSRFKILQGLIKLRQICNHPVLVDKRYLGGSGKLNMLMKQIEEVIAGGHKVLVFSSFVKMLHVFRNEFERKGIKFSYLDGSTTNRKAVVEQFQNDSNISAFLISLKAGGLGLNLTEADYVFIVDPWWNPADEMQAMDRTHRIGQNKNIFVYKTITKDSIEEKILQLQESKLNLVKNVIAVDKGIFKKLGREDIKKLFV